MQNIVVDYKILYVEIYIRMNSFGNKLIRIYLGASHFPVHIKNGVPFAYTPGSFSRSFSMYYTNQGMYGLAKCIYLRVAG